MNCKDAAALLENDFDTARKNSEVMEHVKNCEKCRALYQYRLDAKTLDDEEDLPASFKSGWRESIIKEEQMQSKPRLRRFISIAAVFVLLIAGTALTRDRKNNAEMPFELQSASYGAAPYSLKRSAPEESVPKAASLYSLSADEAAKADEAAPNSVPVPAPQKLIRTLNMRLSTRSFENDLKKIQDSLSNLMGYTEYLNVDEDKEGRRTASLTLRVPQENLDKFASTLEGVGRTVSRTESSEDVSEQYYDTKTRLETQQAKMQRLQDMMKKAVSVEELIQLEDAIADTQYQIDTLMGSLKKWDSKVNYSSVYLTLLEEKEKDTAQVKETALGERISIAFQNGFEETKFFFEDMLVFTASFFPAIIIAIAVIIVVNIIIKKRRERNEK